MTAWDLIYRALREVGRIRPGVTPNPETLVDGLACFNGMVDAQNINRGNIFTERSDLYTLTIGQQAYTIGIDPTGQTTANFSVVRPIRLTRVNVLLPATGPNGPIYRKVKIRTAAQWGARQYRRVESIPFEIYPDYADPLSTWLFYPYPDQAYQIEVWSWQQAAQCGPVTGTGTVTTSGTAVTGVSGTAFTSALVGGGIVINNVSYIVATYVSGTSITLTASAGTQAAAVPYLTGGMATLIVVPPGYYEFWMYSLAIRLGPPFGEEISATTMLMYQQARAEVQSLNAPSPRQRTDQVGARGSAGKMYNWLIGMCDGDDS
jgi:hypothetical protein